MVATLVRAEIINMADDKQEMLAFVKRTFQSIPDYGSLTKRELRQQYLKEKGISSVNLNKEVFSSVVTQVFLEFTSAVPYKQDDLVKEDNYQGAKQMQNTLQDTYHSKDAKSEIMKLSESSCNHELDKISAEVNEICESNHSEVETESDEATGETGESSGTTTVPLGNDSDSETVTPPDRHSSSISELVLDDDFYTNVKQDKIICTKEKQSEENQITEKLPQKKFATRKSSVKKRVFHTSSNESSSSENDITPEREKLLKNKTAVILLRDCLLNSDASDDEKINKSTKKRKNLRHSDLISSDDYCSDEENKFTNAKKRKKVSGKKQAGKQTKQESKPSNKTIPEIERLKRYIRTAGLHVQSYDKLWENCRSNEDKAVKMLNMLHNAGLKGQPTLEKCKKLHNKIERRKELEDLDMSNIITSDEGRPKRNIRSLYLKTGISSGHSKGENPPLKYFSRLKGIVDSEESD